MSIGRFLFAFFSARPVVVRFGPRLVAMSGVLTQLLTLFAFCRQVVVDARSSEVIVRTCRFWILFVEERIPFARVRRIDYDLVMSRWGRVLGGFRRGPRPESFSVDLLLGDPDERRHLFSFTADGSAERGLRGELGSDGYLDLHGRPALSSLVYVRDLQDFLEVPLTRSLEIYWGLACPRCERKNPPTRDACMYCGAPLGAPLGG